MWPSIFHIFKLVEHAFIFSLSIGLLQLIFILYDSNQLQLCWRSRSLDQLVEVVLRDCCWDTPHPPGSYRIKALKWPWGSKVEGTSSHRMTVTILQYGTDCCWGAPHPPGSYRIKAPKWPRGFLLMIHQLVPSWRNRFIQNDHDNLHDSKKDKTTSNVWHVHEPYEG